MFQPGRDKEGGRKKGTENKLSGDLRKMMSDFLESNYQAFIEDYQGLKPVERCKIYRHCLQFVIPRMNSVNLKQDDEINEIKLIEYHYPREDGKLNLHTNGEENEN